MIAATFKGKSSLDILLGAKEHFKNDNQWIAFLEAKALMAITQALCTTESPLEMEMMTGESSLDQAKGRATSFLLLFDLDSQMANTIPATSVRVGKSGTKG